MTIEINIFFLMAPILSLNFALTVFDFAIELIGRFCSA